MKYLFIDTETTGLPPKKDFSIKDIVLWPRLVSVAYILTDEKEIVTEGYHIIKPDGFIIPPSATSVHGITTAEAVSKGISVRDALKAIKPMIEECDYIVGHNVSFDINVLNAEFYRFNHSLPVHLKPYLCTMMLSKKLCGLPNKKYPTLNELYTILNGRSYSNPHNAKADTHAAMECFWILKDSGIVRSIVNKPAIKIYPTTDNILWAAERVSNEYISKAYAFLTIVYNLVNNITYFLNVVDNCPELENIKVPKSDWIHDMFKFCDEWLNESAELASHNKSLIRIRSFFITSYIKKNSGKEFGLNGLIEKFHLDCPLSSYATLILEEKSCWVDIAVESVRERFQLCQNVDTLTSSHADDDDYIVSMIEYVKKIRATERNKETVLLGPPVPPKEIESNQEIIDISSLYKPSSSGCLVYVSFLVGIFFSLCLIVVCFL